MRYDFIVVAVVKFSILFEEAGPVVRPFFFISRFNLLMFNHLGRKFIALPLHL